MPVSYAEAEWASERYLGFTEHSAPGCFVCGPAREWGDGLAIFPGPSRAGVCVAAPWAPDPTLFDKHGTVRPEFVWAALDCPTGFALLEAFGRRKVTLSQLTASLIRPLAGGRALDRDGLAVRGGGPHAAGRLRDLLRERRAARSRLGGAGLRGLS